MSAAEATVGGPGGQRRGAREPRAAAVVRFLGRLPVQIFLAVVAVIPTLIANWMKIDYTVASFYGGTGLLIAVSVAFDLVQKIDSHLVMRNYKGLLE